MGKLEEEEKRCTISHKRKTKSSIMPKRRQHSHLIILSVLISCIITSHAFQTISGSRCSRADGSAIQQQLQYIPHNILISSSSRLSSHLQIMDIPTSSCLTNDRKNNSPIISFSSHSRLFPQRSGRTRQLRMSDNEVSNDEEETNCPVTKLWLSFRKLLARFWALLLKPFQLLKSILTKDITKKDDESTAVVEGTDQGEDVAITKVENIAIVEDEDEEKVKVLEDKVEEINKHVVEVPETETAAVTDETSATKEEDTTKIDTADTSPSAATTSSHRSSTTSTVDLTGNWTLLTDETFTSQYENYLRKLGQPLLVRTVAQTVIGSTKETTAQSNNGQKLFIKGMNVRGSWERTLEASDQLVDYDNDDITTYDGHPIVQGHELKPMTTADGEQVSVASWWEDNGTVHHSWVCGGKKYGGGDFENKRYLTDNGNILVCESTFHPREDGGGEGRENGNEKREKASVTWRFLRDGAIYGDTAKEFPNIFDVLKKDDEKDKKKDDEQEDPHVIVGDIMDSVALEDEAQEKLTMIENEDIASVISTHDVIEEAIERESWVPPQGERWAITAPGIDISGKWKIITTEQWKTLYDEFLQSLGQPLIVRAGALMIVGNTREETKQSDSGRILDVKGVNAKGTWTRSLLSSGSDFDTTMFPNVDGTYEHVRAPIVNADSEKVEAESWWANDGTVHVSWTYGVTRYGGGSFESKRYLENDGDVYVCESTFFPNDKSRSPSYLKWRFLREGKTFYEK